MRVTQVENLPKSAIDAGRGMPGGKTVGTKSKVYVIDPSESGTQKVGVGKRGIERTEYSPDSEGPQSSRLRGSRQRARRVSERVDEKGSPYLAFLAYLAGP